jgi:hypothetical protein
MKKEIFIGLIFASLIIVIGVSGCVQTSTCNKPYILVGTSCCLDQNSNGICDEAETFKINLTSEHIYALLGFDEYFYLISSNHTEIEMDMVCLNNCGKQCVNLGYSYEKSTYVGKLTFTEKPRFDENWCSCECNK